MTERKKIAEIEITPAMIEAGAAALDLHIDLPRGQAARAVEMVFEAMILASSGRLTVPGC